ncbi:hypothetical protein CAPTEDRAFT_172180, partial [Capitella teleta]
MTNDTDTNGIDNPALNVNDNNGLPTKSLETLSTTPSIAETANEEDLRCGYGDCKPNWLQCFNTPRWLLVWLSWFSFVQGFVVNGVNNVNTASVERRFGMTSSEVSLISSSYDISAGIFVLPFSYYGATAHQPRMLAGSAVLMSLGSFVMSIPHFATDVYELKDTVSDSCDIAAAGNGSVCTASGTSNDGYLGVFMAGQFLHGMGGAILYTLGIVILDTSVSASQAPLYQGIWYTFSILGPAVGYLLGGTFLDFYVDFNEVDSSDINISPSDPRWVGAWWIGFLVSGSLFITSFVFLSPYPRELPNAAIVRATRVSQAHNDGSEKTCSDEKFGSTWRDFPKALLLLLKNPVNMLVTVAGVCEGMTTSGTATFLTKLIQNQFALTATLASLISGGIAVCGAALGMFLGGLAAKLGKFEIKGNLIFCIVVNIVSIGFSFSLMAKCPSPPLAGVFDGYSNSNSTNSPYNLTSTCNVDCHCSQQSYEPICSPDGVGYFSPCHAGCPKSGIVEDDDGVKTYSNCSCILNERDSWSEPAVAETGFCNTVCVELYIFCAVFLIVVMTTFMQSVPGINISLRCVPESQRSFAMGVKWVFMRFLGTVLGPAVYGYLFD